MLPSTIDENGQASARQHLMTIVVDDRVAIDAGCLAFSCTNVQRENVRDIVLTHTHLDHVAGLPMFVDDLFSSLRSPIRIHATPGMIEILERDLFNWAIYPRFSELSNDRGPVLEYRDFQRGGSFDVQHLSIRSVGVNHEVNACGYIVSDGKVSVAISGDMSETDAFWDVCNETADLAAIFVECAFPDEMDKLAATSCHLTPKRLKSQIAKLKNDKCSIYAINLKPNYREQVVAGLENAHIPRLEILDVGRVYEF